MRALGYRTQNDLASAIGVSRSAVSLWLEGKVGVPRPVAMLLRMLVAAQRRPSEHSGRQNSERPSSRIAREIFTAAPALDGPGGDAGWRKRAGIAGRDRSAIQRGEFTWRTTRARSSRPSKEQEIEWVDLRFTDPKGKWQHLSMCSTSSTRTSSPTASCSTARRSPAGRRSTRSDMILKPDLDATYVDPFSATPMVILFCDIVDPVTGELYAATRARPPSAPRPISRRPASATPSMSAPRPNSSCSTTSASRTATTRLGLQDRRHRAADQHRPRIRGRQPGPPAARQGRLFPGRAGRQRHATSAARWSRRCSRWACRCDKHHHEVAAAQHELGLTYGTLVQTADRMQVYKYVVHMVAHAYGKTATFMPKPIKPG